MPKPIIILTEDKVNERILFEPGSGENSIKSKSNAGDKATGDYSFAVNAGSANGDYSHAEGYSNAYGMYAHAEGRLTEAGGQASHTEGYMTTAATSYAHAEGQQTYAAGIVSHAEGGATSAVGNYSHVEGNHTIARNVGEHAEGCYNRSHLESSITSGKTRHSVGIGTGLTYQANAFEIMENGDCYVFGVNDYDGRNINQSKTLQVCLNPDKISEDEWTTILSDSSPYIIVIDDFPDDIIDEIIDSSGFDSLDDLIQYAYENDNSVTALQGENICTFDDYIEFDGETVEAWRITYCGGNTPTDMMFIKSPDLDFETMQQNSMYADVNNRYCPFIAVLSDDGVAVRYDGPQYLEDNFTLMFVKEI